MTYKELYFEEERKNDRLKSEVQSLKWMIKLIIGIAIFFSVLLIWNKYFPACTIDHPCKATMHEEY